MYYQNDDGDWIDDGSTVADVADTGGNEGGLIFQDPNGPAGVAKPAAQPDLLFSQDYTPATTTTVDDSTAWIHEIENGLNSAGQLAIAARTVSDQAKAAAAPAKTVSPNVVYIGLAVAVIGLWAIFRKS